MSMLCPKCKNFYLTERSIKGTDIKVDVCSQCKGIWFDGKELETAINESRRHFFVPADAKEQRCLCPRCRAPLFTFPYPHTEVIIDVCKTCEGIWLDAKEFSQIKAARQSGPPILSPDELLVCPKCGKEQPQVEECVNCGLIFAKYWAARKEKEPIAAPSPPQYEQKPQGIKESILDFLDRTIESLARW